MRFLPFCLLLACCAPTYDPTFNAKAAEIQAKANILKLQCPITSDVIAQELLLPIMELQAMTKYRRNSSDLNKEANDLYDEVYRYYYVNAKANPDHMSVRYCANKLDDISLTIDVILKTYGVTK